MYACAQARERGLKGVSVLRDSLDAALREAAAFTVPTGSEAAAGAAAARHALPSAAHPVRANGRIIALESVRLVNVRRDAGFRADPLRALKEHLAARTAAATEPPKSSEKDVGAAAVAKGASSGKSAGGKERGAGSKMADKKGRKGTTS